MPDHHLVLVGLMGSGKTTVGRLLAEGLGRPFVDSDQQVEARTGRTVKEIFEHDGEAAFRALEAEALADAVAAPEPAVIAAAGGTVLSPANRELLRDAGTVVWLRIDPSVVAERIEQSDDDHRPLLADDPEGVLTRMAAERDPLYREVAHRSVEVHGKTPEHIADEILTASARSGGSGGGRGSDLPAGTVSRSEMGR